MEATGYRSYVIRLWSRERDGERATRVVIEEVQSGTQVELRGERAAELGAGISAALESGSVDAAEEACPDLVGSSPDPR